jgi:hypothetical protein
MSHSTLSAQQLRLLVEDKWQRDADAVAVGLHVTNPWWCPNAVEFEFGTARVVRAETVFGVREALLSAEREKGRIILLTPLQQGELGNDVIARLARSRLFPVDHWASLCTLFKAKELDRSVCDPAVAQALLEHAPADGYPPVSAGVLDAGTVWRAVCRHVFEMGESEPDLISLLLWASTKAGQKRYTSTSVELRESLRARLAGTLGEPAESVLRFTASGAGESALALAVACQVVFGAGEDEVLDAAAARMEQYHDNKPISKVVGRTLGRVAAEGVADLDRREDPRASQQHLQRADELLRQFRCDDYAHRSPLTRLGYEQRLDRLGAGIEAAIDAPGVTATERVEALRREVAAHRIGGLARRAEQVARAHMAVRLVRWLSQPPLSFPPSLSGMANVYRRELAFADWAREAVCRGDEVAGLSRAYQRLDQAVLARREEFNRSFARSLADWTATGSTGTDVYGVEDVLSRVVARVVEAGNHVLVVVLDGMSWAVCHELLDDIRQEHWSEATLDVNSSPPPPVIAAVPSVTSYSRTSLLSGRLEAGDSAVEKRNFEAHAALRQCCDKKYPPVLFHKKELTEGTRGVVADDLGRAVISPHHRVVGVVINAIDDRLSGAQQIRDDWTVNRIGPLAPVLKLARDAGRVVVLASDHGHIWHRPDSRALPSEGGGRWRPEGAALRDGEIRVVGSRVRETGGSRSVITLWPEVAHYGRPQNGYHGGLAPQEMVCPLILLTNASSAYSGLYPCEYPKPDWWSPAPEPTTAVAEAPALPVAALPKQAASLFDDLPADEEQKSPSEAGESWIDRLFASPAYKSQRELIRRHAPEDELVRRTLEVLTASGGIMTPAAFCKATDVPVARLDGLIARVQRLLNVDGYEILTLSRAENRVELNVAKLRRQFDLG